MTDDRWNDVARAAAQAFDLLPGAAARDGDGGAEGGDPNSVNGVNSPTGASHRNGTGGSTGGSGGPFPRSPRPLPAGRVRADPDTVERDLMKLVLTIVELLRQLMERTALHRVDQGDLTEDQEERLGMTLMVLHDRMADLCEQHGLAMEDLNLDLGPLGTLLPQGG
jgi:hypothetical protein